MLGFSIDTVYLWESLHIYCGANRIYVSDGLFWCFLCKSQEGGSSNDALSPSKTVWYDPLSDTYFLFNQVVKNSHDMSAQNAEFL